MGLAKAVLVIADHVEAMSKSYDVSEDDGEPVSFGQPLIRADLDGIAAALRAIVTASDEPIPIGLPVDLDELEQLRTEVKRLELFERAVASVSGNYRTPEECALKMLQDAGIERGGK